MSPTITKAPIDLESLAELSPESDEKARHDFLHKHNLLSGDAALQLSSEASHELRIDTTKALLLAELAVLAARTIHDSRALAQGYRIQANVHAAREEHQLAVAFYDAALELFETLGDSEGIARTLTAAIQPQIILGNYARAFGLAARAQAIFRELKDARRLARLENNIGNIYHRQDRFEEAFARYESAYRELLPIGDTEELTISLNNMSMCLIAMNDFGRALASYADSKKLLEAHDLPLVRLTVDYNIAYLHYLQGNYRRAIDLLKCAQLSGEQLGHSYLVALCHLDLSDIYVELNLSAEAAASAEKGFELFRTLKIGYESAKCLANRAIAFGQEGQSRQALLLFSEAKALFVKEQNEIWPWLVELYRSVVLLQAGQLAEARRSAVSAATFFDASSLKNKAALARLLLAQIDIKAGNIAEADIECARGFELAKTLQVPNLSFQALFLRGQIEQAKGNLLSARAEYQRAREELESLRATLGRDELKVSFMKDKAELYERLVELCLIAGHSKAAAEEAFQYIELAKSRSLMERMVDRTDEPGVPDQANTEIENRIRDLQRELSSYHHRIELAHLRPERNSRDQLEKLRAESAVRETGLLSLLTDLPEPQRHWSQQGPYKSIPLENIQALLADDATLLEFYFTGDRVLAAILRRDSLQIVPVSSALGVTQALRMLRFQLSRVQYASEPHPGSPSPGSDTVVAHLTDLYAELIRPIESHLNTRHLIIVPHGPLHYLPFHALYDGQNFLIDSYAVSYAPSAAVYALCQSQRANTNGGSLVIGVPDVQAPLIREEAEAVHKALPDSKLFLGEEADHQLIRRAHSSRFVHISTHGRFRPDNPMFSGIRLGDGYLYLYELSQLKLPAELLTLSGCATGLNFIASGDELLGLIRGALSAGARSLLLTLWDVNDRSTTRFMAAFYHALANGTDKAEALAIATKEIRTEFPHPYFWAPFILVGAYASSS